jgi:hypothetical protein
MDTVMKKYEYHEGPKAGENFKRLATAVLQKPKKAVAPKEPPEAETCWQVTGLERHLLPLPASGWCGSFESLPVISA